MGCPQELLPAGWRIWRGSVPPELGQFAVDTLARVASIPYGAIGATIDYQGTTVGAFKSHHTWTHRQGQLVTGVCIPGISLIIPATAAVGVGAVGAVAVGATDLSVPDDALAVYSAPPEQTDWRLVGLSAVAIVGVTAAFFLALRLPKFRL